MRFNPKEKPYLFWDVNLQESDLAAYPEFVITRIMEYGHLVDVSWMLLKFDKQKILELLKKTRNISVKTATFWSEYYNLNKDEIACLTKESRKLRRLLWRE